MHGTYSCTLTAFVHRPPHIAPTRNQSSLWASIPICLRLPDVLEDATVRPGRLHYAQVKAFGQLATRIQDASLNIGDWITVTVRDVQARIYFNAQNQPRSSIDYIADAIVFRPALPDRSALTTAPAPNMTSTSSNGTRQREPQGR
ncbi:hypothetical protein MXD59_19110 [Frankia sp. Ag45/Mut15]|uniref:Uncharacterized protein n=1 Tax=Frankia umida TaxID=573489 RepID=A0ABT0K252_9ACTN|nr:hypothetical protein [Frankia umida]MCK9877860.1 hypothetical protein [Frankia umida]